MMSFEQYVNYSEEKLERVMLGYCKQVEPELSVIIPKEITALIQLFGTSPFVKFRELTSILNKMTPEKFTKIAKQTIDIVNIFADTKDSMEQIIGLVLQFGIKQPVFVSQYADLCGLLFAHLPKLRMICEFQWVLDDPNINKTFRKMVIRQTHDLFTTHHNHSAPDIHLDSEVKKITNYEELELKKSKKKDNFFAVMVLVGELYNDALIKRNIVYKGVFDALLPPKNSQLSEVDLEGLCRLFNRCGKKLDEEGKKHVDKYLQKLQSHAHRFTFRTKVLVDEIKKLRGNGWTLKLEREPQAKKESSRQGHHNSYGGHGTGRGNDWKHRLERQQEQLFDQLQSLNTQMTTVKCELEQVLTPALINVNTQLMQFQQMPQLLQMPQNQLLFYNLQQSQLIYAQSILQHNLLYQELEKNLKYTQEIYRQVTV